MYPKVLSIKSQNVKVNDDKNVVVITALEDMMPLWPIFFAIINELEVVADPSIIRAATSFSFL